MTTLTRAQLLPFFDLRREIKFAQNPQTVIVRAYDPTDGTALVEKKYSGVLSNLQVRENELLFAVAQRNVGGVELTSRIAALRSYSKHSVQGGHEILVKWYGFDLDDWYTLLSGAPNNPFHQARFLLELLRAALQSLHLLHAAGFVHCDVHNGNWCLPFTGVSLELDGGALRCTLNPDALKLIDLGLSLKPAADRGLPPRLHNAGGGVGEVITLNDRASPPHPRRLTAALDRARLGDTDPWHALDWRLDVWRLGALIDVWRDTAGEAEGLTGPKPLRVLLADLADALKQPEQAALTGAAAPLVLPHEAWVKAITDAIGAPQAVEVRIGLQPAEAKLLAALASKPKATPAPTPAPTPVTAPAPAPTPAPDPKIARSQVSWLKRLASVVAVLGLGLGGTSWWVTRDRAESATTGSLSVATSVPSTDRLEAFAGGPVLIRLPQATDDRPGTLLGSENGRPGLSYRVRVPYKLAIGETEVTFAQWDQCVAENGCDYKPNDEGWGRDRRPVINVTWDAAQQYLHWANRKANIDPYSPHRLRLPTDAEWEYAARAGSDGEFSLGPTNSDSLVPGEANYASNHQYKGGPTALPRGRTVPVASFKPNGFGLYDMHGNATEWTQDCFAETEYERRADKRGWLASQTNEASVPCNRSLRGGSWDYLPQFLRSAVRSSLPQDGSNNGVGFRLARTLP